MRIIAALAVLFLIIGCVPIPEPEKAPVIAEKIAETVGPAQQEEAGRTVEPAFFVLQAFKEYTARYGFDDSGQLVSIEGSKNTIFRYDDAGNLIRVNDLLLEYEDGLLKKSIDGSEIVVFEYFSGLLKKIKSKTEYTTFTYDIAGTLTSVEKNTNPAAMLKYDKGNSIYEIEKAGSVFKLYYDDKGKLKDVDMSDNHIIIGRGKESRLTSLTGQLYGQGEMFDYMDDRIKVISNVEPSEFTGPDNLRLKAFNLYLICTRIKQLDVAFDVIPYAIVRNYFGMDVDDYVLNNYFCEAFR